MSQSLLALPGVEDVQVDYTTKTATIKTSKSVDAAALVKALPERFAGSSVKE